ncbi:MAG: hypothetical protein L0Y56_19980, partial [Nitrospira sp.]|nr:hypothetical protein [Nitrospira sp.]
YPNSYRLSVNEGNLVEWTVGRIYFLWADKVSIGDTIIFFFCKSGEKDPATRMKEPGIYGWGKIIDPPKQMYDKIKFQVEPPSNILKDYPLWDEDIEHLTNEIRQGQNRGTMWPIRPNHLEELCRRISDHIEKLQSLAVDSDPWINFSDEELAALYAEAAEEDQSLAQLGLAHYNETLKQEEKIK